MIPTNRAQKCAAQISATVSLVSTSVRSSGSGGSGVVVAPYRALNAFLIMLPKRSRLIMKARVIIRDNAGTAWSLESVALMNKAPSAHAAEPPIHGIGLDQ